VAGSALPATSGSPRPTKCPGFNEFGTPALDTVCLTNAKGNAGAFFYTTRLRDEPVEGVEDYQNHPLEPISGTLKVTWTF